ncbi:hypothetical protein CROQUDRAFT_49180 [Cronartium quercuum f. sp. fusiforme G11]|uniref:Uncharacterized protein n=1 Tax=Cronartium quercuum f. sp. fusiforme G11 TaxID=708437 RepID=A0A9P6NAV6_9BASI|nr:hypothetical protein CROQUDRAFT_49180 [Cronartium quercuum f. sp. fusiforme G11]
MTKIEKQTTEYYDDKLKSHHKTFSKSIIIRFILIITSLILTYLLTLYLSNLIQFINQFHIFNNNSSKIDQMFLNSFSSKSIQSTIKKYTSTAHSSGTKEDEQTSIITQYSWQNLLHLKPSKKNTSKVFDAGTKASKKMLYSTNSNEPRVWTDKYYPLMTFPGNGSSITLQNSNTNEIIYKAKLLENPYTKDPTSINGSINSPAFHGYSKSGKVQGELIYANYGTIEDFEKLKSLGISVEDKIVIMRYGKNFRGLKVILAERFKAKGVLIYTDPKDDGEYNNQSKTYPNGPGRELSSIQRGSVENLSLYPGDPLTPFKPAYKSSDRIENPLSIPKIPSIPISWNDAKPLLNSLKGFGIEFDNGYFTGPSNLTKVEIVNDVTHNVTAIWNTYALIPGKIKDEVVIIGNHRDAWIFGAADPNSGTGVITEVLKSFGKLLKKGWRPRRTILFTSWDGEELGLVGSTEFVEDHQKWIKENVVVYLNIDVAVAGSNLEIGASPSLIPILLETSKQIQDPDNPSITLYDRLISQQLVDKKNSIIGPLGSGSDYTPFLQHLGIASSDMGFAAKLNDPVYHYHSIYDSTYWMETYGDPGYARHLSIARLLGLVTLRFTESKILPIDLLSYSEALKTYLKDLPKLTGLDIIKLKKTIEKLSKSILNLPNSINSYKIKKHNNLLKKFEQGFIDKDGLKGRPWYRNLIIAPGTNLGYGATPLPGLNEVKF